MIKPRFSSLAVAAIVFVAAPALAQRAPITNGVTSSDLATANAQLRQTTAEMRVEINDLKAQNAELTGQVETLDFLLGETREELNDMREDDRALSKLIDGLEGRLAELENELNELRAEGALSPARTGGAPISLRTGASDSPEEAGDAATSDAEDGEDALPEGSLGTISVSDLPGGARELFAEAKSKLVQSDYAGAEELFQAFLGQFADDPQAGEAQYWLGESLFRQDFLPEAGEAYKKVLDDYPDDAKAPDALVKLARTLRLIGNPDTACAVLQQLPKRYPSASGLTRNTAAVERVRSGCD